MPRPVVIVCVGMAGSGKTTFMQRINAHLHQHDEPPYIINLDPAVLRVPFTANIDIRQTVDYKEVMRQYNLGPNGGILTALNLFTTKIDQVLDKMEARANPAPPVSDTETTVPDAISAAHVAGSTPSPNPAQSKKTPKPIKTFLIDTPGQIEVFVWSASGAITLDALASSFPTVLAYIIDTPRTASTSTFMSNMLYACSILYKTRLPMVLVFNKIDVKDHAFAHEWMTDFEAFQAALATEGAGAERGGPAFGGSGYMGSLLNSMSMVLEEFYSHLKVVGVSSMTGEGVEGFFDAVREKAEEFEREYVPELEKRKAEREARKKSGKEEQVRRLMEDMKVGKVVKKGGRQDEEQGTVSDYEDDDDAEITEPDPERLGDSDESDEE